MNYANKIRYYKSLRANPSNLYHFTYQRMVDRLAIFMILFLAFILTVELFHIYSVEASEYYVAVIFALASWAFCGSLLLICAVTISGFSIILDELKDFFKGY